MKHDLPSSRPDIMDWLTLRLLPQLGSVSYGRLLAAFGSPAEALSASEEQLKAVPGISEALAEAISRQQLAADPLEQWQRLHKMGARLICLDDDDYPPLLAQIHGPPPLLFVRGDLRQGGQDAVAIVGSRKMSPYGRKLAHDLAFDLAQAGVTVVSGLAMGIDASAHEGALKVQGHSIGVLGCGIDIVYPPVNAGLTSRLAQSGAVISEFPLGVTPQAANFPMRNRIISGLCRAVVVVEADLKSGSLITANHALEQGREVFAVPGPVGSPTSRGCHELLRQGAGLLTSAEDILGPGVLSPEPAQTRLQDVQTRLPAAALKLLEHIGPLPAHIDDLCRASGLPAHSAAALLVDLELEGLIVEQPGKMYLRINF